MGIIPANTGRMHTGYALSVYMSGIIPANTGRISAVVIWPVAAGDHPREYGENALILIWSKSPPGSSPRIRGE